MEEEEEKEEEKKRKKKKKSNDNYNDDDNNKKLVTRYLKPINQESHARTKKKTRGRKSQGNDN